MTLVLLLSPLCARAQPAPGEAVAGPRPLVNSSFSVAEIRGLTREAEGLSATLSEAAAFHVACQALRQSLDSHVQNPSGLWIDVLRAGKGWAAQAGQTEPELRLRALLGRLHQAYWQLNGEE